MLVLLAAFSALAGVTLTPAQVRVDVQVACAYTGGRVRVLAPEQQESLAEILAGTCAEVRSCSARAEAREVLDWHGRRGSCALYYRPAQEGWTSEALGHCGPVAAGRAITPLLWPPAEVDVEAWCARDPVHPVCLLPDDQPVAWHGTCPPGTTRQDEVCTPDAEPLARGSQTEWLWVWQGDVLHAPSAVLPPRLWLRGHSATSSPGSGAVSTSTGVWALAPWVVERVYRPGVATGRAPRVEEPPAE